MNEPLISIVMPVFNEKRTYLIDAAKSIGADIIELHTGHFCDLYEKNDKNYIEVIKTLEKAAKYAFKIGLEVHAGHGITFESAKILSKIKGIKEYNIGHFLIGESIFLGLKKTIKKFKNIIN